MLQLIKRKLSVRVSVILAMVTIPPMIVAAALITSSEDVRVEQMTLTTAKVGAMTAARAYGAALEAGIDAGLFTVKEVMEPAYREIRGGAGPVAGFQTTYDSYCDNTIKTVQDKVLESASDFVYAVGNDRNGYSPTPNVDDRGADLAAYRVKARFSDTVPKRATESVESVLVQQYRRDDGAPIWDVSAPVYVKGQHWGAFRVGVADGTIVDQRHSLMLALCGVFGFLVVVTVGSIFLILRRAMRPLETLAVAVNEISTGEATDRPITVMSIDEIGQMTKAVNRLRASIESAMKRLGE